MKLIDFIKKLFDGENTITTADGQKAITLDSVLPEIDGGLELFEKPGELEREETVIDVVDYVTREELSDLITRLMKIEELVQAVDNLSDKEPEADIEIW